jgi:hypothetical protein
MMIINRVALLASVLLLSGTLSVSYPSTAGIRGCRVRWSPSDAVSRSIAPLHLSSMDSTPLDVVGQTELPNDFQDAANRAVEKTMRYIRSGGRRCRIDFDTSIGDVTYTSLKNTMPVLKEIVKCFSTAMELDATSSNISIGNSTVIGTIRLFFPDMGAAALTRRDWKMGSASSEVPSGVFTSNIQNDGLTNTDKLVILVCPLYSEADYVQRVVQLCDQGSIPCIMLNADLINMDQGYGVRARNIRKNLMATFITTYKLKTLSRGAVVREWPNRFTVWKEDQSAEGGYVSLQSVASDPSREELDEMFDVSTHDSDLLVCRPLASIHPSIQLLYNPSCRQRTTLRQRVREAMLWVR